MKKVIFTADTMIAVIKQIFEDEDLDTIVETSKTDWNGKKLSEILNLDYYSHKHVASSTEEIRNELLARNVDTSMLEVLKRSFCLVNLDRVQRLYSHDIDHIGVEGTLQFWMQAEKVKLLEALIEAANISLCGLKLPVVIDGESRRITLFFDAPQSTIDGQTEIGESAIVTSKFTLACMPNISSYADYDISFLMPKLSNPEETEYVHLPIASIQYGNSMTQKATPLSRDKTKNNTQNLSNVTVITLVFDGYIDNRVVEMLVDDSMGRVAINVENPADNNKKYFIKVKRLSKEYIYSMKIKDATSKLNNDTGGEQFTMSFSTGE